MIFTTGVEGNKPLLPLGIQEIEAAYGQQRSSLDWGEEQQLRRWWSAFHSASRLELQRWRKRFVVDWTARRRPMDQLQRGHSPSQEDHSGPATTRSLLVRFRRSDGKVLVRLSFIQVFIFLEFWQLIVTLLGSLWRVARGRRLGRAPWWTNTPDSYSNQLKWWLNWNTKLKNIHLSLAFFSCV